LDSPQAAERQAAIGALAELGTEAAVAPLGRMLDDPLPEVRIAAVQALGRLRNVASASVALCRALKDADVTVRQAAAEQFGQYGYVSAPEALGPLRAALTDDIPQVRAGAARALGRLAMQAGAAVPELVANLRHAEATVRSAAAEALGSICPNDAAVLA